MKRYPEYKESGVGWIGDIPNHWRHSRLKFHLSENSGGIWGQDDELGTGTYVLRSTEITIDGNWNLQSLTTRKLSKQEAKRFLLKKGDLIVTKSSGSQDHIGKTGLVDEKIESMFVCYSNFVQRIRLQNHIYSKFLHYFLNCPLAREQYKYQSETTTGLANLSTRSIDELLISVPPTQEQTQISAFLDHKTKHIDELIRVKERKIELLREQRTALINQAVTKGLDPNVAMKPSGVEWIGEIPAHWTISRVKHEFESLDNARIPLNAETRGSMKLKVYDYYGASGVIDKVEDYIFHEPLILIGEDGANLYLRSTPLAFKATGKYWVNNHAHVLRPKHGNIDYLTNLLESLDYTHYITGAAQPKLTSEHLMNISVVIPPTPEQTQIADFLDHKTAQIDKLASEAQRSIELLKEYRQSLISDAVTGKIDARSEV